MKYTLKSLAVLAFASFGIGVTQASLVDGDFSSGIASTTEARLTASELDLGWFSHVATFVGGSDVATTGIGEAEGHIVSQVFSNTQTGLATLNFDWTPAASEELNYAVYGYNAASGNLVFIRTAFSNNGPVDIGGGTSLVSTFPPLTGNGATTGTTTSAEFDITGYTEIAVAFWQPVSASGSVLDNVSIVGAGGVEVRNWDGADTTADADGGSGTWDSTTTNWDDAGVAGTDVAWSTGAIANFLGSGGTVTLAEPISASELIFNASGYEVVGTAANTLTLEGSSFIRNASDATISAPLADVAAGGITKTGGGTLTLSGDGSAVAGPLTVSQGRLDVSGTVGGPVVLADIATVGGEGSADSLTLGSVSGATLAVDAGTAGALTVGDLELAAPFNVLLEGTLPATPATITLVNYTGTLTGDPQSLVLQGAVGHYTITDTGSAIVLNLGASEAVTFTDGAGFGEWFKGPGLPTAPNFEEQNWDSSDGFFFDGDDVTFDDSVDASFGGDVNIVDVVSPASVTVDDPTGDYSFIGGEISGSGSLTKESAGNLVLNNPNSFTGGVTVNGGTLAVEGAATRNRLAAGSVVTVNNGGIFEFLSTNPLPTFTTSPVDFVVNAGGTVTTSGAGTNHNHFGDLTLNGGTVTTATGVGSYNGENYQLNGDVTVGGSALSTLDAETGIGLADLSTFTVADSVTGSATDLLVSASLNNGDIFLGGVIKEGPGTMVLSGASNTYTEGTTVNEGCVVIDTPSSIPAEGVGVTVGAAGCFGVHAANFTNEELATLVDNVTWDAATSQLVLDTQGGDVTVGTDFAGLGFEILATGGGSVTLSGDVSGVIISDDGATTVNFGPGAATSITDVEIATSPGTTSGIETTLTFTADGLVDIYASETLQTWGAPIATNVSGGNYVADDQSEAKRFYVIVPAGQAFPQ